MTLEVIVVSACAVGLVVTWLANQARWTRWRLRRVARRPIAGVAEGERARVIGTVTPFGRLLVSPVTGRACIGFAVEARRTSSEGNAPTLAASEVAPFVLEDETGRAVVFADGAQVAIAFDTEEHGSANRELFAVLQPDRLYDPSARFTVREGILRAGERVAVLGAGTREPDPDATVTAAYRDAGPTRLRLTSSAKHPLLISNERDVTG